MASSSDWITALANDAGEAGRPDQGTANAWMQALLVPDGFVEGAPFEPRDPLPQQLIEEPDEAEPPAAPPTPDPIEEAEARGQLAGRKAADAHWQSRIEDLRKMRLAFRALDQAAMDSFAEELAETVVALCSAAIADFAADPECIAERCKKAAARLGSAVSECKLHLHPEDLALIDQASLEAWEVIADPSVERSGLRFEGPDGSISDTARDWRRAISAAIKG